MDIYLPIAGIPINAFLLLALGVASGFISGMFGVGGGFILTPFLVFIGIPADIAVGTQSCQLAGTTLSGALAHWHRREIDVRMGLTITIGAFVGTTCGVQLFKWLQQTGHIDLTITFGYAVILISIGGIMLYESWLSLRQKPGTNGISLAAKEPWGSHLPFKMNFPDSRLHISILAPLAIGFVCGVLVAIFGVGGGFMLVPSMIYLLRMPTNLVNGTSLYKVIFTTSFTAILQSVVTHSVDIVLALFLLIGSVVGAQWGARHARTIKPELARLLLAVLILAVAGKLIFDLTLTPVHLFSLTTKVG